MEMLPYLFFTGQCAEALNFYKSVFKGDVVELSRFGDSPMAKDFPERANDVMHARFKSGAVSFHASDGRPDAQAGYGESRISLCVETSDESEARRVFDGLSSGGKVDMPLASMFWGALFGSLTDKYGIDWMVNCQKPS
jgi:PhnB protein